MEYRNVKSICLKSFKYGNMEYGCQVGIESRKEHKITTSNQMMMMIII